MVSHLRRDIELAGAALSVLLFIFVTRFAGLSAIQIQWFSDIAWTLVSGAVALRALIHASQLTGGHRRGWLYVAAGACCWFLGMLYWSWAELVRGEATPFPAISDIGFLALAPFFLLAMRQFRVGGFVRRFAMADITLFAIITLVVVLVHQVLFIEQLVETQAAKLYVVVLMLYPALYMAVIIHSSVLFFSSASGINRISHVLLLGGLLFMAITNSFYAYSLLGHDYAVGHYLDVFWVLEFAMLYAAIVLDGTGQRGEQWDKQLKYSIEQYSAALALGALTLLVVLRAPDFDYANLSYVMPTFALLLALISIHQVLMFQRESRLYRRVLDAEQQFRQKLEAEVLERTEALTREARQHGETAAQLELASRAKSDFLSRMSHELRTPLNAVLGFSELLMNDDDLDAERRVLAGHIHTSGGHLLGLVDELLDIARIERGSLQLHTEVIALSELLNEAIAMTSAIYRETGITLHLDPIPTGCQVRADRLRLRQVLVNLLTNAAKYNRPGGRVDVSVVCQGNEIQLRVADTGVGIADTDRQRIFDNFSRAAAGSTRVDGLGIGLFVVRQLVRAMGGDVTVHSCLGEGSTFTVILPVCCDS